MELILTHSNTDFDGLAAQLAAARLFPGAVPVLSAHLNDNLRAFLALAQEDLPFVQAADLPHQPITRLILVDTDQRPRLAILPEEPLPTLVIDHHPPDRPLLPHEERLVGESGATTTLLAERLIEAGATLSPLEATLLLLGIYEDTGHLSLPGTRRADLLCAAWLLDQGARINAISEFLARPLSASQEQIYHELEHARRVITIGGWPTLITTTQIDGTIPELSPLAHRLHDAYGSAITILAIGTAAAGAQLIIRADPEALDAGALAARFGGGGHAAAAAAFVHGQGPAALIPQIELDIAALIRPALTAADVMTAQVQTIPLDTTVAQAAQIQARSGHSALPVIDGERVVRGLIARRDLDRALRHGLEGAPIERYMWRGPRMVAIDAPVTQLRQALLDDKGRITGRLLVVDSQRRLLGIVTRADLLRTWELSGEPERAGHADTAALLARFLDPAMLGLLRQVAERAERQGWALYLVGGTVRDMLLDRRPGDLDLLVEGDAIGLARLVAEELGGVVRGHAHFGTASIEIAGAPGVDRVITLDFVTARTEFYERPAALPEVEIASLRHDLHRRDFTINTLAICLNPARFGRLHDFYGGRRDLDRRLIRVLHNLSFIDDPTRVLRAARLAIRLGCAIETRTRALIEDAIDRELLQRTSPKRVLTELLLVFEEPEPERVIALLAELGALQAIHPALTCSAEVGRWLRAARLAAPTPVLRAQLGLALLLFPLERADREAFLAQYTLDSRTQRCMRALSQLRERLPDLEEPAIAASRLDQLLRPIDRTALWAGAIAAPPAAQAAITRYLDELSAIQIAVDGDDLRAMGLRPGPQFRELLDGLRAARLDGLATTRAEQLAWVQGQIEGAAGA